ncbi:MAG: radical SAM protein [Planctomycetes bacterium]|nr:radical SAM protein [Planctomycetota bacterium]
MRVLALNPPYLPKYSRAQRSPQVTRSGTLYYPLWLAYATGWLERAGHEVRLIDAPASGLGIDPILEVASGFRPGLAIVDTSTPSIESDADAARRIKERCPSCVVGLVGPHVSALPEDTLECSPGVDFVAIKEYDETCREVADALAAGGDAWRGVAGLALRDGDRVARNPARGWITDLDALPFVSSVYRNHLDYRRYFYSITRWPVIPIVSGRGCPFRCEYCVYPQTMTGHRYRARSVENVAEEFVYIERELPGVREVFIEDDTLTLDRSRVRALCEELIRRGCSIGWTCNSRPDVDPETLRLMAAAGCRLLCVGVESGDQDVLDRIGKGIRLEQIERFFRDARRAGLLVHGCFMMGNRGETVETMRKTLDLARRLRPDTAQFYPLMVYPGTLSYRWAREENLVSARSFREWLTPEGLHRSVVDRPDLPRETVASFCQQARRRFYLRPSYMARKLGQVLCRPRERTRIFKALRTFARHLASE